MTYANIQDSRAWCEIDLDAITHNFAEVRRLVGPNVQIIPALKRNGYGCGAGPVSLHLERQGADGFAVGDMADAVAIRRAGATLPILLYGGTTPHAVATAVEYGLTLTLSTPEELDLIERHARSRIPVYLKVDVGLVRAGAFPTEALSLAAEIGRSARGRLTGIYAHFYTPENTGEDSLQAQFAQMHKVLSRLDKASAHPLVKMVGSTDVLLRFPGMHLSAVNPGRMIYGAARNIAARHGIELRPALSAIKARLSITKSLENLEQEDFPNLFAREGVKRLGLIPIGWGDGLPKPLPPGIALVRGRPAPFFGPIHVEHMRLDLTHVPDAQMDDEVVLLGRQGDRVIDHYERAEEWAGGMNELQCRLPDHLPRFYACHGVLTNSKGSLLAA